MSANPDPGCTRHWTSAAGTKSRYEKPVQKEGGHTGRDTVATRSEFGQFLLDTVENSDLESRWETYVQAQ